MPLLGHVAGGHRVALDGEAHRFEQRAPPAPRGARNRRADCPTADLHELRRETPARRRDAQRAIRERVAAAFERIIDAPSDGGTKFSMNRSNTRAPSSTSATSTASAGLWLMPPLQRTNSMPIGGDAR